MSRRALIDVALGTVPADLVISGGKLVNVLTAEIYPADVAIKGKRIAYVGNANHTIGSTTKVIDATGFYVTPGLIDTHQHSYETHLSMTEYARLLLTHGTTTIAEAFYGVANVGGIEAVRHSIDEIKRTPLKLVFLLPLLSYTQNASLGLPSTPNALTASQLLETLALSDCRGLEDPPLPAIVTKDPFWLEIFETTLAQGKVIMGYGPGASEHDLAAYLCMGASCDNSAVDREDALIRLRMGCRLNAREGTVVRNLRQVVMALVEYRLDGRGFSFCGDTVDFLRIVRHGHVDYDIRLAVSQGVNPITAVQMATLNAAEILKISDDFGMVAPGKIADVLIVSELEEFIVDTVIADGEVVVKEGRFVASLERPTYPAFMRNTVRLERPLTAEDFLVHVPSESLEARVRAMYLDGESNISKERHVLLKCDNGDVPADPTQDVLKISMIDRYLRGHQVGVGFIQGLGLHTGAIGTTFAPMSENIIVAGTNNRDMAAVGNELTRIGGGFAVARGGTVISSFETPLYGLLYDGPLETAIEKMERVYEDVEQLGCRLERVFYRLGFMGPCAELKYLKITPQGLVDVMNARMVPTVIELIGRQA